MAWAGASSTSVSASPFCFFSFAKWNFLLYKILLDLANLILKPSNSVDIGSHFPANQLASVNFDQRRPETPVVVRNRHHDSIRLSPPDFMPWCYSEVCSMIKFVATPLVLTRSNIALLHIQSLQCRKSPSADYHRFLHCNGYKLTDLIISGF